MASVEPLRDRRARAALNAVSAWSPTQPRLRQEVKGLPVLVRRLGLAQAVALLWSRGDDTRPLAADLSRWLFEAWPSRPLGVGQGDVKLFLQRYAQLSSAAARALDEEGLRYAEALKLMCGGLHGP